ncbi:Metallo-dependent phosphatase-like protein [Scleroderma citrinum]
MFLPLVLALVGVATAYPNHFPQSREAHDPDRVEQLERSQFFLRPPESDLVWGDLNVLHTTDIHGWLLGHQKASWPEPNYSGDLGDFASFVTHMKQQAKDKGVDLLLVDSGDIHDGTGLSDGYPPGDVDGHESNKFLRQLPYDVMSIGNHELEQYEVAYDMYMSFIPNVHRYYLSSNVNITILQPSGKPQNVTFGKQYARFTTGKYNVTAFGVIYNNASKDKRLIVQPVEDMIKEPWFTSAIAEKTDVFLLVGHIPVAYELPESKWQKIVEAIRNNTQNKNTPILIFGGHSHVRNCTKYGNDTMALQSGRYMDTIGWMSANLTSPTFNFSRRYLDQNRVTYQYHIRDMNVSFDTPEGLSIAKGLADLADRYNLTYQYGMAPKDYLVFPKDWKSKESIWPLFIDKALPVALATDSGRANIPNITIMNNGVLRYNIFKGPFTQNDQITASPYPDVIAYFPDVNFTVANNVTAWLNTHPTPCSNLRKRGDIDAHYPIWLEKATSHVSLGHQEVLTDYMTPGYVTNDTSTCPDTIKGDDTLHYPIDPDVFPPHYMNSTLPPNPPRTVDLIFLNYTVKNVVCALNKLTNSSQYNAKNAKLYSNVTTNQVFGLATGK